jgi:hypothetical protein
MKKRLGAMFVLPAFVLSGCAFLAPQPTEEEILTGYFSQFVDDGAEGGHEKLFAQSGSFAEAFASDLVTRIDSAEADGLIAQGEFEFSLNYSEQNTESEEVVLEDASLCVDSSNYPQADRGNFCFLFTNFQFGSDQLVGFETAGDAIHGRVILEYFGPHAMPQPADMAKAADFAVADSFAEAYAIQQSQATQSDLDGGDFDPTTDELVFRDGILFSCYPDYKDPDVVFEDVCSGYSEFLFDGDRLWNFKAGDSFLDDRVVLYDGTIIDIGDIGTIEILSAYITISGNLSITAEVTSNTKELNISRSDVFYIGSNGRQIESSGVYGAWTLREGRVGNVSYLFSGGTIGGDLEIEFYDENYNEVPLVIWMDS